MPLQRKMRVAENCIQVLEQPLIDRITAEGNVTLAIYFPDLARFTHAPSYWARNTICSR